MPMNRRLLRWLPVAALAGGAWGGCSLYGKELLVAGDDAGDDGGSMAEGGDAGPPADAADGGSGDGASDADAGACVLALPPPPPTKDDPSDGGDLEIVLAIRTFDLGLRPDGGAPPLIGYDLDGLCTCPGLADCVPAASGGSACDEPGGRDNAGGALLRQFYTLSGGSFFSQDTLNAQIAAGLSTLLVRIRQYNGTPEDTQVELSVYVSDGTPPLSDGGAPATPSWTGQDAWIVDGTSVFGANGPPIVPISFDESAYVTGGVLVGALADFFVPLQVDSSDLMVLELRGGIVTGALASASGGWSLSNGVIDGRLAATSLLAEFAHVHDPSTPSAYLCPASPSYADLKGLICPALDITADPAAQHTATCDALSLGIGFTAQSAQFGPVQTVPRPTTCPDGGPDHC
jgi:hypothetical protein